MTNPSDSNFDATRDPRTGRPLLPIDAHNNRKAEAESQPVTPPDRQVHEGERPEALAKFAEVARNDDGQPVRNGTEATEQTAPIPTDPRQKQDAATRVLREGVLKQDQGAEEAIDRLPDRTAPRHRPQGQ